MLGLRATDFRLWAPIQVTRSNPHTCNWSAAMALQAVLLVDQRPAAALVILSASTGSRKTTELPSVARQVTLLWTCLIRRLTPITPLQGRGMSMAVAGGE